MSRPVGLGTWVRPRLGPIDIAAVKLFASNRNGAEPINVLWRDITIQADRINGLGTIVRSVFGEIVYADPTSLEKGVLVLGGQPKAPFVPAKMPDGKDAFKPLENSLASKMPDGKDAFKPLDTAEKSATSDGSKGQAKPAEDTTKVAQKDTPQADDDSRCTSTAAAAPVAAAPPQAVVVAAAPGQIIMPAAPGQIMVAMAPGQVMMGGPPQVAMGGPPQTHAGWPSAATDCTKTEGQDPAR